MKVKVKHLEPNPFRRIDKYPIDRNKVESLKLSIQDTSFWDNILARPNGGKYKAQIAYGHHRLIALQELGVEEVDIPLRPLTDAQMIKIMANENMDEWKLIPKVMIETVLVTRDFLNAELAKYGSWEEFAADGSISGLYPEPIPLDRWRQLLTKGVGRETILKFLNGAWKSWQIQDVLVLIDKIERNKIDEEALDVFDSHSSAVEFAKSVERYKIPKSKQKKEAEALKSTTHKTVDRMMMARQDKATSKVKPPEQIPHFIEYLLETVRSMAQLKYRLEKVSQYLDEEHLPEGQVRTSFFESAKTLHKYIYEEILSEEGI